MQSTTETIVLWALAIRVLLQDTAALLPRVLGAGVRIGVAHLGRPTPDAPHRPVVARESDGGARGAGS